MPTTTALDPDRLLPVDPRRPRPRCSDLYQAVATAPILSPHGHVAPSLLLDGGPLRRPRRPPHHARPLRHAAAASRRASTSRRSASSAAHRVDPREVWRLLRRRTGTASPGTASGYWLDHELRDPVRDRRGTRRRQRRPHLRRDRRRSSPTPTSGRARSSSGSASRSSPRPTIRSTTYPATRELRGRSGFAGRVLPTFRPDRYLDPEAIRVRPTHRAAPRRDRARRRPSPATSRRSRRGGRTSSRMARSRPTTASSEPFTVDLDPARRSALPRGASRATSTRAERATLPRPHAAPDGAHERRGRPRHDGAPWRAAQPQHGDASSASGPTPGTTSRSRPSSPRGLRPLLERFGLEPGFHLVLFAVDETVYSREIAPLAGFYPSVYIGAPWWFLDAPDAIRASAPPSPRPPASTGRRVHRRHPRVPLDPGAPRHGPPCSTRPSSPGSCAEGRVSLRDRPSAIARDLVDAIPREVFKL